MKKLAVIACTCTALAATSAAALDFSNTDIQKTITVCHSDTGVEQSIEQLSQLGWEQQNSPLSGDLIDVLSWTLTVEYITGDGGGAKLEELRDIHRKTAAGYSLKRDFAASKTRILSRKVGINTEGLLLETFGANSGPVIKICTLAISNASLPRENLEGFDRSIAISSDDALYAQVTKLDKLSFDGQIPTDVIVKTTMQLEASQ